MKQLSSDEWAEVADLIDQCILIAEQDVSYSDIVSNKTVKWLITIRNKAVDNSIAKKKES